MGSEYKVNTPGRNQRKYILGSLEYPSGEGLYEIYPPIGGVSEMRMLISFSIIFCITGSAYSQDLPEQFRIWEKTAKDYRYMATLDKLLDGNQSQVADEARKYLEDISSQIELRHIDYDPISGGRISAHPPGTYEAWRMRITDFIKALIAEKH